MNQAEKWTQIARVGTFTDSAGRPQTFTPADLAAIAAAYKPEKRDAPLVFGHPNTNAPAFGWVERLKTEDGKLFAQFAQVPGEVRDLVAQGRYRHVSMSLMPDRVTLRHVGLLGAAQPAIDGLAAVELASTGDAIVIEFTEPEQKESPVATMEELQQQVGALTEQVNSLKAENTKLKGEKDGADAEKNDAEKKAADTAAEFAAFRHGVTVKTREARMDALVKAGKVRPAERNKYLNLTASLAKSGDSHDFAAPDGTVQKVSAEEQLFRDLESREPCGLDVNFAALAEPGHAAQRQPAVVNPADVTSKL